MIQELYSVSVHLGNFLKVLQTVLGWLLICGQMVDEGFVISLHQDGALFWALLPSSSLLSQPEQLCGRGNVKLERAQRNWGITYSRSCCFCYTSTLCTERAKGNKIALEKHWGRKEYWRILRIMRTSMKLFAFLWSFLPKDYSTCWAQIKSGGVLSCRTGQPGDYEVTCFRSPAVSVTEPDLHLHDLTLWI